MYDLYFNRSEYQVFQNWNDLVRAAQKVFTNTKVTVVLGGNDPLCKNDWIYCGLGKDIPINRK